MPAPQSVCWAHCDGTEQRLYLPHEAYSVFRALLKRGDQWVNHHTVYDAAILAVEAPDLLPAIFEGFDTGQIRCTMIREKLIRIARGEGRFVVVSDDEDNDTIEPTRFDLGTTAWRWLRHFVNKKDYWRTRYALLHGKPLSEWPQAAIDYPLEDARVTRRVYLAQEAYGLIADEIPQHSYAWALRLVQLWGVRTDGEAVSRLKERLSRRQTEAIMSLLPRGIFRQGGTKKEPKFVKTMAVIRDRVSKAYAEIQEPAPLTKKGAVSTASKTLKESADPVLLELADALGAMKLLSSFIPVLESGRDAPICADYNVLVESGRTSCRKPNMQQLPRGTEAKYDANGALIEGAYKPRECFVARPGKAWVSVDYEMAELVGQGQMAIDLVGFSVLADQINAGQKPILAFAGKLLGISYDETVARYKSSDSEVKKRRQDSKGALYGLPGGMRAKKLWQTMVAAGNEVSFYESKILENAWRSEYPEFPQVFKYVQSQVGSEYGDTGTIVQLRSGRVRGGVDYPAACNTFFQGLIADTAKTALRDVVRECYLETTSPLYGSRVVVFAHDEIIVECDVGRVHEVGYRIAVLMKRAAAKFMPDVKMGAEPAAMLRWTKDSFTRHDLNGKLVPCDS